MAIGVTAYVDCICSHTWSVWPHLERLQTEFGGDLRWRLVPYPLVQQPDQFGDRWNHLSDLADIGPHWAEVSEYLGAPINHSLWRDDPVQSTWPAAVAYWAACRQDAAAGRRFFAATQAAALCQKRNVGRPEVLQELAREVGLASGRFAQDLYDEAVAAEAEAAVAAAAAKGVRTRPTLVFQDGAGQEYWVVGPRPYQDYRRAAAKLQSGAELPGGIIRVGGRIFNYADVVQGAVAAGDGGLQVAMLDGAGQRQEGTVPLHRPPRRGPAAALDLTRIQAPLVAGWGRSGGRPVAVAGIRTVGQRLRLAAAGVGWAAPGRATTGVVADGYAADYGYSPAGAMAGAEEPAANPGAPVAAPLGASPAVAALAGAPLADAGDLAAVAGLLTSALPLLALKWQPRPWSSGTHPLTQLADGLAGDFLFFTLADPVTAGDLAAFLAHLRAGEAALRRLAADPVQSRRLGPGIADALAMRQAQLRRLQGAPAGAWLVSAFLLAEDVQGGQEALAAALGAGEPYPLRVVCPGQADWQHLRGHLASLTPCAERELQGTYRWASLLTAPELAAYLPPLTPVPGRC